MFDLVAFDRIVQLRPWHGIRETRKGRLEPCATRKTVRSCHTGKAVALDINNHSWRMINAVVMNAHNRHTVSINSRIQRAKSRARGYGNRGRFRNAIYFHRGTLTFYPSHAGNR